jgi:exosortase D (VPLPA-CTERM-specific)
MPTTLTDAQPAQVWSSGPRHWTALALIALALLAAFIEPLRFTVATWSFVEEYSYGYFIPLIVAFLVWQKADQLRTLPLHGAWSGLALIALALVLRAIGDLSAIRLIGQYGFIVAVFGVSVCSVGWRGTRVIAVPLALLLTMIPLPQFALRELSHSLQLLSSQLGVGLIRAFDISVFLEGNVIDLGSYKLQVVEACSGLRYLFPLIVLGFLAAYFFQGALWERLLIVVSTVPLTIIINSARIGLIGVTVEHWGPKMAEGLLHDFEGWFMFMICIALLIGEMALLARLRSRGERSLRSVFGLEPPASAAAGSTLSLRQAPAPALAATALLAVVAAYTLWSPARTQSSPERASFVAFPMQLEGGWQGRSQRLEPDVLAVLALSDYVLVNFSRAGEPAINFYSAYYASQSGGESSHSPRTCLPGDGWAIVSLNPARVTVAGTAGIEVNRALIQKGEHRQLVYYWFRQRGRTLTDEFAVKWFILRDGIVDQRSDGALLRLVTVIAPGDDESSADRRLSELMAPLQQLLPAYIPD